MTTAKILIVTRKERTARELQLKLEKMGFTILAAVTSGPAALVEAERHHPDLALVDTGTTGDVDAVETARHLRLCLRIPVVYVAASVDDEALREVGAPHPLGYVLQPVQDRDLYAAVQFALHREAVAQEAEARYHSLFAHVPVGLYRSSPQGWFLDANPTLVDMLGYPDQASLLAVSLSEQYADPQDRRQWQALLEQQDVIQDFEARFRKYDGSLIWIRDSARAVRDDEGRLLYYEGSLEDITARVQAEEALATSQALLTAAIEQTSAGVLVADAPQGTICLANAAALGIRGETQESLTDIPLDLHPSRWNTFYPDGSAYAAEDLPLSRAILQGETTHDLEVVIEREDGGQRWVSASAAPILDAHGEIIAGIVVFPDITERKHTEEALRRHAAELQALQETILDIIVPHDLPALLEKIVERAARLLNAPGGGLYLVEADQQQVRCVVSYNTPRDYRGLSLALGEGAAGAVAATAEALIVPDYSVWPQRVAAFEEDQPFRGVIAAPMIWQGQVIGVIDVFHIEADQGFTQADLDLLSLFANYAAIAVENARLYGQAQQEIAERKRLERQSEERRLYLERVLDCTPDAIVTTDAQHRVLEWNPGAEHLFGYRPAEAVGHSLDDLIAAPNPEMLAQATGLTRQVLDGTPVSPIETTRYRQDGTPVQVTVAAAPILVAGKPIGVVAVYTDITQRKQAEAALQESEANYRRLFEDSPVSLWEQDFSAVKQRIEALRAEGITDWQAYFDQHPEVVVECLNLVKITAVNNASLKLYEASSREELLTNTDRMLPPEAHAVYAKQLAWIAEGQTAFVCENINCTLAGERINVRVHWAAAPGYEDSLSKVHVSIKDITQQKRAEAALRESEDRYRDLVEHSQDLICTHDLEGWVLSANRASARLMGYSEQDLTRLNLRDILVPEFRGEFDDYLAQIRRDGVANGLMQVQTKTGDRRIWQYTNTLRTEGVDEPIVRGTARDITEQVRAEQALRRSEAQYRTSLNAMSDAVHVVDRDQRIVLFNDAFKQWNAELGLSTDVISKDLLEVFPFLPQSVVQEYWRVFETGQLLVTTEATNVAGREFITETRKIPVFEGDSVVQVITVIRDVTDRERAAQEIRQLVEFNESIIQNMAEGIAVEDAVGTLTFLNPAAVHLLGHELEELIGQHWTTVVPADQQPIIEAADRRRQAGAADRYEVELLRKDGSRVQTLISGSPRFSDGEFVGTLAVFTDISERVRAEKEIRQRTAQLEALREVGLELAAELNLDDLLHSIVSRAVELMEGTAGGIYLYRPDLDALARSVSIGPYPPPVGTLRRRGEGLSGKVWESGEAIRVSDYRTWEGRAAAPANAAPAAVVGVPVRWGDEFLGVLTVSALPGARRNFSPADMELLGMFATQAAIAIENARLFESQARRRREAETLQAATQALTATLDLQQVFESILRELRQVVPYDSATVQRLRGEHHLEIIGGHGFPNLEELLGIRFDLTAADNPNRDVVQQQSPLILADAAATYEEFRREPHAQAGIRAWLGVPLLFGERLIGMIALDKQEPAFYTEEHAHLAQAFAAQAAIAIENARLFQETEQRLNELRLLFDASTALSTSLDPGAVTQAVSQRIVAALQVEGCAISTWDREQDTLITLLDHSPYPETWEVEPPGTVYSLADYPATRQVLIERRPHVLHLSDPDTDAAERARMKREEVQTLLLVPMIVRDNVIGLLELMEGKQDRVFTTTEIALCQTLANQAAAALENVRLLQAERIAREQAEQHAADLHDRERFLTLLTDITRAALETPDLRTMLQTLADRLGDLLEADGCYITLWDQDRQLTIPAAAHGPMREIYPSIQVKPGDPTMTKTVLQSGQVLCEEDFENSIYSDPRSGFPLMIESQMALPLIAGDEKLGAAIFSYTQHHRFSDDEVIRGEQIARQVALALAKAKLVDSEREQRKLAEVLREAAQVMGTSLELDEILRLIMDQLQRVLICDAVSVLIFREGDMPDLVTGIGYADEAATVRQASHLLQRSPILERMARDLQPVLYEDVRDLDGWIWVTGAENVRSWLGIPLVAHERMIGALMVDHAQPHFFGPAELQIAQTLARHAAQAVENARLYEAEQRRARQAAAVSAVVQALNATTQLDTVFQVIAQELGHVFDFDRLSIALLSDDHKRFVMYALSAEPDAPLPQGVSMPTALTACAPNILAGRPHLTPDLAAELEFAGEQALYETGLRSRLNVPLMLGETVIGALNLASTRPEAFSPQQLPVLRQVADAVAAAIQNAQLYEETLHRNRELALLNRVMAASAANQAIEPLLETVCFELAQVFDAALLAAALTNANRTEATLLARYPPPDTAETRTGLQMPAKGARFSIAGQPLAEQLLELQAPLLIEDAARDPRLAPFREAVQQWRVATLLILPLLIEEKLEGSIGLAFSEPRRLSRAEIDLAQRVAEQAASALARTRLIEAQHRLSTAVEQAAEAIVITDTRGTIVYVNPALEWITGYTLEESIGFGPYEKRGNRHDAAFFRRFWEEAIEHEMWQGRLTGSKPDGSPYTVDAALTPVRNKEGQVVNYVATLRDVTREVQLEERIRQAQKMEALGQLAGGIAHDFNNLLTVISLSTQLLRRQLHPQDPLWEHVLRIDETSERATKLTKQLLSFSRREVIEPLVLNLNQVVGDLGRMLQRVIGEDIQLKTHLTADLWPVKVDPSQMDQVIMNMVINARDAMPHGGTLTIETANVELDQAYAERHMGAQPGKHVRLSIRDTGVGIEDEVLSHLFEPFFTTKERGQGTGLGLATVFGIITQSRGHIRVESEVGRGTTFHIHLPCAPQSENVAPAPKPQVASTRTTGTETILVVEDKADIRQLAVDILRSHGYSMLQARDGIEALQIAEQHQGPIHLLLTDVVMPHMDGRMLAQALAQVHPEMRMIFMSGYADGAATGQAALAPGTPLLTKPFAMENLIHGVRAVLDRKA